MIGLFVLAVAVVGCPVEHARYTLRHHPNWTASFRSVESGPEWPGAIALAIHDGRSGKTSWWLPWNGGTDGLQHVASTTDVTERGWRPPNPDGGPRPLGDRQYLGFDARYDLIAGIPRRGRPAPAHLFLPDSAGARDTAFVAKQFFDLTGCTPPRR